jgi:molecular chaperone GrpE
VTGDVLRKVLPAVDDFERAMETVPDDIKQHTWYEGISLIKTKLHTILESEGVTPIETEGESFDPRYHEAVTYEEADGYKEGQIIGQVQRGYMLGERVLRAALVRVAKDSTPPTKGQDDTEENSDK